MEPGGNFSAQVVMPRERLRRNDVGVAMGRPIAGGCVLEWNGRGFGSSGGQQEAGGVVELVVSTVVKHAPSALMQGVTVKSTRMGF